MSPSPLRERLIIIISVNTPHSNKNSRLPKYLSEEMLLFKAASLLNPSLGRRIEFCIIMTIYICFLARSYNCCSSKSCLAPFLPSFLHLPLLYSPHWVPRLLLHGSPRQLRTLFDEIFRICRSREPPRQPSRQGQCVGEQR